MPPNPNWNNSSLECLTQSLRNMIQICRMVFTNHRHTVYPLEPVAPKFSEFLMIDTNNTKIRIIHITPNMYRATVHHHEQNSNNNVKVQSKSNSSLSEEYWFTKTHQDRLAKCNCSFRQSLKFSSAFQKQQLVNDQPMTSVNISTIGKQAKLRVTDTASFIDRLIQDVCLAAFQEYSILERKSNNRNQEKSSSSTTALPQNNSNDYHDLYQRCHHHQRQHHTSKPLIILIHGIGACADMWWIVMHNLLCNNYEVVAPDLLGHGFSSTPSRSSKYTFTSLLITVLMIFDRYVVDSDCNGMQRKCILIGHSYGCSLVTALYRHRAAYISHMILISGGGPTPLAAPLKQREITPFGFAYTLLKPLLLCGLKRSFLFLPRGKNFPCCMPNSAVPLYVLHHMVGGQEWSDGDAAYHRRILVPTLLVHGLQDKCVTLVQQCEMERTIPRAFLEIIPNAGHLAMLETPEHLSHMISCFIDVWG